MCNEPQDPKTFKNSMDETPRISSSELVHLIKDHSNFDNMTIIDCRSKAEYKGGHIKGSINFTTPKDKNSISNLYHEIWKPKSLFIFHCELSLFRGPSAWRNFNEEHSKSDSKNFLLHAFVLNGGYREFYAKYPENCDGGYITEANSLLGEIKTRED